MCILIILSCNIEKYLKTPFQHRKHHQTILVCCSVYFEIANARCDYFFTFLTLIWSFLGINSRLCGISGEKLSESPTDFLFWLTSDPGDLFSFINDRMTNYAKQMKTVGKKGQTVETISAKFHDQDSRYQNNSSTHTNSTFREEKKSKDVRPQRKADD